MTAGGSPKADAGSWCVVTGAGGGIGLEIVRHFVEEGPVLAIDIDRKALARALRDIESGQRRIKTVAADISSPADVSKAFAALPEDAFVRCLVNCAAVFDHQPAKTMSHEAWSRVIGVNLTGAFLCSQAAYARMRRGDVVVNIGSINGYRAIPTHANYAASKAGLKMLTKSLAVEWAPQGIRVVSVSPGIVDTPMNRRVEKQAGIDSREAQAKLPLRRYASPTEVAQTVRFVASDAASYISGTDILVDGAWTALGAS